MKLAREAHKGGDTGRSWPEIELAGTKALLAGEAPHCRYHVGIAMQRITLRRKPNTTVTLIQHDSTIAAFRCPIEGCHCVSGRTEAEEG